VHSNVKKNCAFCRWRHYPALWLVITQRVWKSKKKVGMDNKRPLPLKYSKWQRFHRPVKALLFFLIEPQQPLAAFTARDYFI